MASAADLGGAGDPHIGAPDENATARMLAFVRATQGDPPGRRRTSRCCTCRTRTGPTASTRRCSPSSRTTPRRGPTPRSCTTTTGTASSCRSARWPRCCASSARSPGWDDTVVVFLSDHGEQFREHGGLYHLTSLFDEQVRVPGWLVAGDRALDDPQRARSRRGRAGRTYTQDVHATLLDLLGVLDARRVSLRRSAARPLAAAPAPPRRSPRCSCPPPAASGSRTTRSTA